MNQSVFLDTCIFYNCIEKESLQTIINHAKNLQYSIRTSITVIGEFIDQIRDHPRRDKYIQSFYSLLEGWGVEVLYPNLPISIICFRLGDEGLDYRMENTDRVHLGYAIVYRCNFFLTSDKNLIKYRLPKGIEGTGYLKPVTLPLEEFKDYLN
jgi:hypothetical protein